MRNTKSTILQIEKQEVAKSKKKFDHFTSGDLITVKYFTSSIKKKRQLFTGICISKKNKGLRSTITVRSNYYSENLEQTFPLYSPLIDQVIVEQKKNTRASKLYYLRNKNLLSYIN